MERGEAGVKRGAKSDRVSELSYFTNQDSNRIETALQRLETIYGQLSQISQFCFLDTNNLNYNFVLFAEFYSQTS